MAEFEDEGGTGFSDDSGGRCSYTKPFRAKAHPGFALYNSALKGGVNTLYRIKGTNRSRWQFTNSAIYRGVNTPYRIKGTNQ
jgi:hypothetical protein